MISEEVLATEYIDIVSQFYPQIGTLIRHCYIRVVTFYWGNPPRRLQQVVVYCPHALLESVKAQKDALKDVAKDLGLSEVVCRNATLLVRDPLSKIKYTNSRFWLELNWVATTYR